MKIDDKIDLTKKQDVSKLQDRYLNYKDFLLKCDCIKKSLFEYDELINIEHTKCNEFLLKHYELKNTEYAKYRDSLSKFYKIEYDMYEKYLKTL